MALYRVASQGEYDVLGKLGQGNFSTVFKVEHTQSHQQYAMKVLTEQFSTPAKITSCEELLFMREIGSHPDIVSLHDCLYEPSIGRLSMIIDLMECNLLEFMRSRPGPFPPGEALALVRHLLSALQHLHSKGLAHRDVKPENCFVTRATLDLKLGDFGSMRNLRNANGQLSEYVATRWYRPPEILLTSGFYGVEMDNWAVGCILAELLLGRPIFPGSNSIDQLNRIHRILGSPSADLLLRIVPPEKLKAIEFLKCYPQKLETVFRNVGPDVIDLLTQLLAYVPSERLGALAALQHPAFYSLSSIPVLMHPSTSVAVREQPEQSPLAHTVPGVGRDTALPKRPSMAQKPAGLPAIHIPNMGARVASKRGTLGSPPRHAGPPQPGPVRMPHLPPNPARPRIAAPAVRFPAVG